MQESRKPEKAKTGKTIKGKRKAKTAGFWMDFLRDKKVSVLLYLLTVCIFLLVGGLYDRENVSRLFYAVELSAFFWIVCGFFQGRKYVAKRKLLALFSENEEDVPCEEAAARENFEETGRAVLELGCGPMEMHWLLVMKLLEEEKVRRQSLIKEQQTAQNDYYLMWAHQIKTPIAAMKLLLGSSEGNNLFLLREELFKIEQYVEMVLHFQRLQSMESDLVLQEYDLYDLLKQSVRKYSVLFINKGVSLQLDEISLSVLTDEKWFGFCIEQILSNSIKYTVKGVGKISVYLSAAEENVLVIEDNGIGIRGEDLPRIFERGFTGYNGRMDKKSTGIGLYLCKQILDRLGNEIWAKSEEGKGTKMYLRLYRRKNTGENLSKM